MVFMDLQDALRILDANHHCTIACASRDGEPWVAPVFFNYDDRLRIVFESGKDTRHARLLAQNPRAAIVVADTGFRGTPAGVYLECEAHEAPPERLEEVLHVFLHGPHEKSMERTAADYQEGKPLRLYEAIPTAMYGLTQVEVAGCTVDQRVEIALP